MDMDTTFFFVCVGGWGGGGGGGAGEGVELLIDVCLGMVHLDVEYYRIL